MEVLAAEVEEDATMELVVTGQGRAWPKYRQRHNSKSSLLLACCCTILDMLLWLCVQLQPYFPLAL